jgi:DMSO/TMAO reductase YedYZ molybdopterin-dependent catalytic subunit
MGRDDESGRLPPGQWLTEDWPVLHEGVVPPFDEATWSLRVFGRVRRELSLRYADLRALPAVERTADFHCVTTWSRYDNRWTGLRFADLLGRAQPLDDASFVLLHCDGDYTTNLPLGDLLRDDCLLAWGHDGAELSPEHGHPLRAVIPHLYGWKSAKWVRGVELLDSDAAGFWERRGYHRRGDPWSEERYAE